MVAGGVPGGLDADTIMRAIYTVAKGGVEIARLKALIWVRLTAPGVNHECGEDEGECLHECGEINQDRGCALLPGKETVVLDYIEE